MNNLYLSPSESKPTLRPLIVWALTYRCNLRCRYCYVFTDENEVSLLKSEAPPNIVEEIADSLIKQGNWQPEIIWLTGGEPTQHSQLPWLVEKLESAGIMTVVTTNGVIEAEATSSLIRSRPRGIMVALDSTDPDENNQNRRSGKRVLETISLLAREKAEYTTLGVAAVVTQQNMKQLNEFAKRLQELGVDYLSLNPIHHYRPFVTKCGESSDGEGFEDEISNISKSTSMLLPSSTYLELLNCHFLRKESERLMCPASYEYAFITPWGQVFPCSCEFWHRDPRMVSAPMAGFRDFAKVLSDLRNLLKNERFTTHSECYSSRCVSCWKWYYDSVFVRRQSQKVFVE